jgi:L-histidine Nalpha-methyltransferase
LLTYLKGSTAIASAQAYRILSPTDLPNQPLTEFAAVVLEGLSEIPKRLSSRYLYDDRGSELFREIMDLEEYYPTRCEAEILSVHGREIARTFQSEELNLVDLGAGDGVKTLQLLGSLADQRVDVRYVPIDISEGAMADLTARITQAMPDVSVAGLVAEYTSALHWLTAQGDGRRNFVLFLGSNIGNFNKAQARTFLRRLWSVLNEDDYVLIGFDLKKDIDRLLDAYNDAKGVTAQFNLNLLTRINRELGGHFDATKFRHYSTYDVFSGAMESYLVSMQEQTVAVDALNTEFAFLPWEPVHTEYSYKYLESDIADLANATGFAIDGMFSDDNGWFCGSLWKVCK